MPDYSQAKIYRLFSPSTNKVYIGATSQKYLSSRLAMHKENRSLHAAKLANYITSIELTKYHDCQIELIENFPCTNRTELGARERYHLEQNKINAVNKMIPIRTPKEYYQDNKPIIAEFFRKYYQKNSDRILQKAKETYELKKDILKEKRESNRVKCECGGTYTLHQKHTHEGTSKHKKFINPVVIDQVKDNIEPIIEPIIEEKQRKRSIRKTVRIPGKVYIEKPKEHFEQIQCECGGVYTGKSNKINHDKTQKHEHYIQVSEQNVL